MNQPPDHTPPTEYLPAAGGEPAALAEDSPPVGVSLFGDYLLFDEIARGGMGVVYRARQVSLDREVALKMILVGGRASPTEVSCFRREAEAVAQLDHPNVVPVYDVGEHDGRVYFTMKLIDGGSLADHVDELLDRPRSVAALMIKVARAVHHAHQRGILHRDLKPANVLLSSDGPARFSRSTGGSPVAHPTTGEPPVLREDGEFEPMVVDFGLARRVEGGQHLTQSGAIVGTPAFMPPEQARGEKVLTTAADVYSLGAVLYQCLTGSPPFAGANPLETLRQVLDNDPRPPRQLNPSVPRDLEIVCLKCLQKDPVRRYFTAAELADELQRWLDGEPIRARPVGALEWLALRARRRPAVAALSALVVAVALLGAGLVAWKWRDAMVAEKGTREQRDVARRRGEDLEKSLGETKRARDAANVLLAQRDWREGRFERARELLARCDRDLRDWEWHYLHAQLHPSPARWFDQSACEDVAVSSDGSVVAAYNFLTLSFWDARTGKRLGSVSEQHSFASLAVSPDGKRVAGATYHTTGFTERGVLRVLDVATNKHVEGFSAERVWQVGYSPDGRFLACCEGGPKGSALVVRDAATGKEVRRFASPLRFAFGPGRLAVVGEGQMAKIEVYDTTAWKLLKAIDATEGWPLGALNFSPDGKLLVGRAGGLQGLQTIVAWEADSGKVRFTDSKDGRPSKMAISADSRYLATGWGERAVQLWNLSDGSQAQVFRGSEGWATGAAFSPDGRRLYVAGLDGRLRVWGLKGDNESLQPTYEGESTPALAFPRGGEPLALVAHVRTFFAPSEPGERAPAPRPNRVSVYEALTGRKVAELTPHAGAHPRVEVSPAQDRVVTRSRDDSKNNNRYDVRLWDLSGKLIATLYESKEEPGPLSFNGDGSQVRLRTAGGVRTWDAATGRETTPANRGPSGATVKAVRGKGTTSLIVSENGRDRTVTHVGEEAIKGEPLVSHDGRVVAAVVTALGDKKGEIILWDVETASQRARLRGHAGAILALTFNPTGTRLFTLGTSEVKCWDANTGQELISLPYEPFRFAPEVRLQTFPDGRTLALLTFGKARYWLTSGYEE